VSLATFCPNILSRELVHVRSTYDALALSGSSPSLAVLRRDFGAHKIETVIKAHLIDLCDNINLKRPLRDIQIDNIAREVVAEFYSLTMADIHVIFRKAKMGEYGEFFESLDMPKVMTWFREYFSDRCAIAAQENISGRFRDANDPRSSELARRHFDKLEQQFRIKNNKT